MFIYLFLTAKKEKQKLLIEVELQETIKIVIDTKKQ